MGAHPYYESSPQVVRYPWHLSKQIYSSPDPSCSLSFSRATTLHVTVRLWNRHNCVRSNTHRKAVEQALQLSGTLYITCVKEVQYAVKNIEKIGQ